MITKTSPACRKLWALLPALALACGVVMASAEARTLMPPKPKLTVNAASFNGVVRAGQRLICVQGPATCTKQN